MEEKRSICLYFDIRWFPFFTVGDRNQVILKGLIENSRFFSRDILLDFHIASSIPVNLNIVWFALLGFMAYQPL